MKNIKTLTLCIILSSLAAGQSYALEFDQNVTPDVIFGSGNDNGSFTVDRNNGVELGLRGKLRHNALGFPENTFNSNGDGTYSFAAGVAPTQSFPTAVWSIEWAINSDYDDSSGLNLNDLVYKLGFDSDPSLGTSFAVFDPINDVNPANGRVQWDHAIGDNSTGNGGGTSIPNGDDDAAGYATLIDSNKVAQNSWKAHWVIFPFDPTVEGNYEVFLTACDSNGDIVASTTIQIIVGDPDDDGDGLPNSVDDCPNSDLSATIVIDGCDSGVENLIDDFGCTISDLINECAVNANNHGQFVQCVSQLANALKKAGIISGKEKGAIQRCAARADLP